tara:strand:+ start:27340 stop:28689 length:1350 start_codon:yes stop_codon:yes gene_type:complete
MTADTPDRPVTPPWYRNEDWLAVLVGGLILAIAFLFVWFSAGDISLKQWLGKPGSWATNPIESVSDSMTWWIGPLLVVIAGVVIAKLFQGESLAKFIVAVPAVFLLATVAYVMAGQETVKHLNLSYALWALVVGLVISNTIGVPDWLRPGVATEFYIKTGLVILGAEVLLHRLLALGLPGICVAWIVTPVVLITTYWFGQKVLKIESKSLNMVVAADMSVCGVSAAIATAASCRAKKEELSFAISISLIFTVVMMVVMPLLIKAMGLSSVVGGAWLGGTIDSTGAVVAAGASMDAIAEQTAATVKMIQNILIGVTAFGVAVYWVTRVETESGVRPDAMEIWRRFPKFVLGFVAASVVFTVFSTAAGSESLVDTMVKEVTKGMRGWFFCLAFVSIGLETRFADLKPYLTGGKPLILYVCGQTLNLVLTLLMAYLMFGVIFADTVQEMLAK